MRIRLVATISAGWLLLAAGISAAQEVRGVSATEIRLGTQDDLSGPIVSWGQPMRNGKIMRIEEQNDLGGVNGRKLLLIGEDNGYDPKKGVLAAQKLIQQDKVFAMVGVLGTAISMASMPISLDAGVPFMYPGSNSSAMYEPFDRLKFSMAAPYGLQMNIAVQYMVEKMGKKKIAVLYQDDEFGTELRDAAEAQAKAMGIPVVAVTSYKRGDTAFSSQVARIRQAGADLIVAGTVVRETAGLGLELQKIGWKVDVLASAAACTAAVPAIGKDAVEGFYVQCQYLPFNAATESEPVKAWMKRYQERFGTAADVSSAIGYDMMELAIIGLQRAGRDLTVEKFIAASETIKNWQNLFGSPPLSFGPDRRLGTTAFVLTRITGGRFERVTGTLGE